MSSLELPLFSKFDLNYQTDSSIGAVPSLVNLKPLEDALKGILPTISEEKEIVRMRRIFGKTGETLSDEQIQCATSEFQFLINTWMDEFEKDVFNGMTLKEVLNEK